VNVWIVLAGSIVLLAVLLRLIGRKTG